MLIQVQPDKCSSQTKTSNSLFNKLA